MKNKLFIGNLSFKLGEEDLQNNFSKFGEINDIHIPVDRDTGRKRGFAFIEFADDTAAKEALNMNGTELDGRALNVSLARERQS